MRLFRRKKGEGERAPAEAAAPQPEQQASEPEQQKPPGVDGGVTPARRRRGSRGGRGRKKKPTEATATATADAEKDEKPAPKASEEKKRERPKAKPRQRRPRERPKRIELPPVKKEIFVSVEVGEQRVAILEDGKPAEVYLERRGRRSIAGNVYKGVVDNVLPGMEASFVEIGLAKNGFLYVDEIVVPELEGKRHGRRIQELIERGQEVLVQAVKDPMGTKGARLTTEVSLPGRFLVYVPFGDGIGISRRLEDAERERLKAISKELELPDGGIIVRTAAEGASKEELEGDLAFLRKLWATIQGRADRSKAPTLVYQEAELPLRIIRDLFNRDVERVVVDHDRTYRRIVGYLKRTSPELTERVELYTGRQPLMEKTGVDEAIRSTLNRRVELPSGGSLIFDYAEAFTVVDVNTGRFVGARGKGGGARLEDTITKNNLEAVAEVVRQLRLRDIGGIIVIDFIDMANPKNRESVEHALRRELERDRTKTYVVEISPLGLVEMTRQNVTDGPREILTIACPTCSGDGIVVSDETHAIAIERELRSLVRASRSQAFRIELHSKVASILTGPGGSRIAELEEETGRRFVLETRDDVSHDHFAVLARGPVARIDGKAHPVSKGQELQLRLESVHQHNVADAVGQVDGYEVAVAGAGRKVGKTVKVRVERATSSAAYAVLADQPEVERPVDPETQLEAEDAGAPLTVRTTKEPKRSAPKPTPVEEQTTGEQAAGEQAAEELAAGGDAVPDGDAPADAKPKRKSRRGSRGGRGRKKKPAVGTPATEDGTKAEPVEAVEPAEETPEPSAGGAEPSTEKPKKKTRRGSRGGRGRRKKAPAAEGAAGGNGTPAAAALEPEEPVASVAAEEEPG